MRKFFSRFLWILSCVLICGNNAWGTLIYNDGGTHLVNFATSNEEIVLQNATTVHIEQGADITAPSSIEPAVISGVNSTSSTLNITGGNITGGTNGDSGGEGVIVDGGFAHISGGFIKGGFGNSRGGAGIIAYQAEMLIIDGGTIMGGSSNDVMAASALTVFDGTNFSIEGGNFIGDKMGAAYFYDSAGIISGGSFEILNIDGVYPFNKSIVMYDSNVDITGGLFSGDLGISGSSVVNIYGTDLQLHNGTLTGTLLDGNELNCLVTLHTAGGAQLILHNVPIPTSLLLFLTGLAFLLSTHNKKNFRI